MGQPSNRGQFSYIFTAAVRSGLGQGVLEGVADLSAGALSVVVVVVFAAGFLASPHPMTPTTATSSIAANSCFIVRSP
jgi:hypothetical protein